MATYEVIKPIAKAEGAVRTVIELDGQELVLFLTLDWEGGVPRLVCFTIDNPGREGITSTLLRLLPLQEYVQGAARALLGPWDSEHYPDFTRPTPEALRAVRVVYRTAQMYALPPAKAVQEHLGLSLSTTTRWIKRAHEGAEVSL